MSALLNTKTASRRGRATIRTRVLAIAFLPSLVFLLAGSALAGYLIYDAIQVRSFATKVHDAAEPAGRFFAAVREERRLTLQELSDSRSLRAELEQIRAATDATAQEQSQALEDILGEAPANVEQSIIRTQRQVSTLPEFRERVDAGDVSLQEAYDFYNRIIDQYTSGLNGVAQETPSAETAYMRLMAMPLFTSSDAMSRGDALASAGITSGGMTEEEFRSYISQVGAYHSALRQAEPNMIPSVREQYEQLVNSPAWQTLTTVENAFLRGNQSDLPVPETEWRAAAAEVSTGLWNLYVRQSTSATNVALDEAEQQLTTSVLAAVAVLLVAAAAFFIAWRLSTRLIKRLTSLRAETLDIAEERMPRVVERVRGGESVDLSTEVSYLDHGEDEIGQVADAFNKAQQTAIAAAVDEAKTREGTKRVFLNIAHRSQVIVHRQLQALDAAERKQEDPDQLDMLFRLDHLSTRARRNAENLIILGGEQPGRQFRNPVAVSDLVRGATAETEEYKRVTMGKLPATAVAGPVVGDLVHLLAELIDNATSFSPPQSRVEVRGELVGRGAVIEVEDQGIGMESEELDRLNEMLGNPPDFSFMALSDEPRLGLFVVARLAAKHGLTVTLRDSAYGGTRAIVLVRSDLLSELPDASKPSSASAEEDPRDQALPAISRRPRSLPPKAPAGQVNGSHTMPGLPTTGLAGGGAATPGADADPDTTSENTVVSPAVNGTGPGQADAPEDAPATEQGEVTDGAVTETVPGDSAPGPALDDTVNGQIGDGDPWDGAPWDGASADGASWDGASRDGASGNSVSPDSAVGAMESDDAGSRGDEYAGSFGDDHIGARGEDASSGVFAGHAELPAEQSLFSGPDRTSAHDVGDQPRHAGPDAEATVTMRPSTGPRPEADRDEGAEQTPQRRPELPRRSAARDETAPQHRAEAAPRGGEPETPARREAQVQREAYGRQSAQSFTAPQAHARPQTGPDSAQWAQQRPPQPSRRRSEGGGQHALPQHGQAGQGQPPRGPQPPQPEQAPPPHGESPPQYAPRLPREPRTAEGQPPQHARHRHDSRTVQDARPAHGSPDTRTAAAPSTQEDATGGNNPMASSRPALPRRRKQQNLAPQLREEIETTAQHESDGNDAAETPDQARSRLSAFQQGTRRARHQKPGGDETGD